MTKIISFTTSDKIRVDEFLRRELPARLSDGGKTAGEEGNASNSKIRRLIVSGCVKVNGRECRRPAFELRGRSSVEVAFDEEKFFYEKQPDDIEFTVTDKDVLSEDENLIFINKPAMFPVEQTITGNRKNLHDAVVDYLWKRNPELRNPPYVGIMHRLDRETSGVILFTKNRPVNKPVHDMFERHDFIKEYYALCVPAASGGADKWKAGKTFTVEGNMDRISGKSQAGKWGLVSKGGLYSKTDFEIVKAGDFKGKKCVLVHCFLHTGRTHQTRVHLSSVGLPLLGDELYGGPAADRIHLHAARLACDGELKFDVKSPVMWKI